VGALGQGWAGRRYAGQWCRQLGDEAWVIQQAKVKLLVSFVVVWENWRRRAGQWRRGTRRSAVSGTYVRI